MALFCVREASRGCHMAFFRVREASRGCELALKQEAFPLTARHKNPFVVP